MNHQSSTRRYVPWNIGFAFGIFILYLILAPMLAGIIAKTLKNYYPDFSVIADANETLTIQDDENESSASSSTSSHLDRNSTEDAPLQVSDSSAAADSVDSTNDEAEQEHTLHSIESPALNSPSDAISQESNASSEETIFSPNKIATQHPMARLLIRSYHSSHFRLVVILFFFSVVILAPIAEELVFRVTLQGTTEKTFQVHDLVPSPYEAEIPSPSQSLSPAEEKKVSSHLRRAKQKLLISRFFAVISPALFFAALHTGAPEDISSPTPLDELFHSLVVSSLHLLLTILLSYFLLIRFANATTEDLGLGKEFAFTPSYALRFLKALLVGAALLLIVSPLVFGINSLLSQAFPNLVVAPIPILVFALLEGFVYLRTHSFPMLVGMHMALNSCSFLILLRLIVTS